MRYMTTQKKTATLNLRIRPDVKLAADKAADADNRSTTSLVETLLIDYLRAKGFLKK